MRIAARAGSERTGLAGCVGAAARVAETPCATAGDLHLADTVGRAGALALAPAGSARRPLLSALEATLAAFASSLNDGPGRVNGPIPRQPPKDRPIACSASARRKSRPSLI